MTLSHYMGKNNNVEPSITSKALNKLEIPNFLNVGASHEERARDQGMVVLTDGSHLSST